MWAHSICKKTLVAWFFYLNFICFLAWHNILLLGECFRVHFFESDAYIYASESRNGFRTPN